MPNHYAALAEQNSLYTVVAKRGRKESGKASRQCLLIGQRGYWQASTGWSADDSPTSYRDELALPYTHSNADVRIELELLLFSLWQSRVREDLKMKKNAVIFLIIRKQKLGCGTVH